MADRRPEVRKAVKQYLDKKGFKGQYTLRNDEWDSESFDVLAKPGTKLEKLWDTSWVTPSEGERWRKDEDALNRVAHRHGWAVADADDGMKALQKQLR